MDEGKIRVGIIYGGRSAEHRVSVASAKALLECIDREKYEPVPIGIGMDGTWHLGAQPARMLEAGGIVKALPAASPAGSLVPSAKGRFLADRFTCSTNGHSRVDVIFPLIHGTYGEDGTLQGLIEMAGLPYVGSGVLGSAIGMDKWTQKLTCEAVGVPVTPFIGFREIEFKLRRAQIEQAARAKFQLPVFVKPSNSGSSMGITKVKRWEDLEAAIETALRYDRRVLIERGLDARELETAILGNDEPRASRVGEILPQKEWYDYEAKYSEGGMRLEAPAKIPGELEAQIQSHAIRAFTVLDGAGMARIDFFFDRRTEELFLNEINTIPGFTAMSVYSKLWEASGIAYRDLVDRLIQLALERHRTKEPAFLLEG